MLYNYINIHMLWPLYCEQYIAAQLAQNWVDFVSEVFKRKGMFSCKKNKGVCLYVMDF